MLNLLRSLKTVQSVSNNNNDTEPMIWAIHVIHNNHIKSTAPMIYIIIESSEGHVIDFLLH